LEEIAGRKRVGIALVIDFTIWAELEEPAMEVPKVIKLIEYKARLERSRKLSRACEVKDLPDEARLWELLDRNISLKVWKKKN
jgi:hypothetical protein